MPHPLPRMDFSQGIPTQFRTLVVVPTMLTGPGNIAELIEALEVRFLANRDDNLHFALLTDFRDAPAESMPEDEALLRLAQQGNRRPECKVQRSKRRPLLPFPPPAPLESPGPDLDGL